QSTGHSSMQALSLRSTQGCAITYVMPDILCGPWTHRTPGRTVIRGSGRGRPHRALSVEDLQRVMVGAWPAMETARLGDWVLRASRGFTQRANSVMTAGSPGTPMPAALDSVERWYAARALAPNLTVAGPVGFDAAGDAVGAEALRRGYVPRVSTLTLT